MIEINQKKNKQIQNKAIQSPLRPKFRNKNETNIYFKSESKQKNPLIKKIKYAFSILLIIIGGYLLFN